MLSLLLLCALPVLAFPMHMLLSRESNDSYPLTSFNSIPAVLPPLRYAYDALEPIISEDIMVRCTNFFSRVETVCLSTAR